ncbi:MAG: hypothetical protein LUD18_07490 [Lachnospiraceae bacterium]|nr:hypothetical protein [Lachnospiraceae bacterium]
MENNELLREIEELKDEALEQAGGGMLITLDGELHISIPAYEKMNDLWNAMHAYGEYGRQVRTLVNRYTRKTGLQRFSNTTFRDMSCQPIEVYAKDSFVQVNGVTISK